MGNVLIVRPNLKKTFFLALAGLLFFVLAQPTFVHAGPVGQTATNKVVDTLKNAFNKMDLNGCLALMTDDATVQVVNPSDLATGTLTKDTLTYKGKQGTQSQVANFFNINFTNGFTISSTNFKTTDTSFNGPMQLAIRDFVIDTDVQATLEGGKIKTLIITDKNISRNTSQSTQAPPSSPSTGNGEMPVNNQSPFLVTGLLAFALTGLCSFGGLVVTKKRKNRVTRF